MTIKRIQVKETSRLETEDIFVKDIDSIIRELQALKEIGWEGFEWDPGSYGTSIYNLHLYRRREETDEEYEKRVKKIEKKRQKEEDKKNLEREKRRKQYEELKKEFE